MMYTTCDGKTDTVEEVSEIIRDYESGKQNKKHWRKLMLLKNNA